MEHTTALVVGEDENSSHVLCRQLDGAGFKSITASTAKGAIDIVAKYEILLVLCDWEIGDLCGAELCSVLREAAGERYLYFIFVCSSSSLERKQILYAGADTQLTQPVDSQELDASLQCAKRVISSQASKAERVEFLEFAYASVTSDLRMAAKVQEDLLPRNFRLAGFDTNWVFKPANFVAGDMFDYFPMGSDYFVFYILDVEGHGIASALTSFAVNNQLTPSSHGLCANMVKRHPVMQDAVVATVKNLNRQFQGNLTSSRYFTMVYGIVDVSTGEFSMTQAGHPSPIVLCAETGIARSIGDGGMPVGLLADAEYSSVDCSLKVGDRLFLYSDGMIECENDDGEPYGTQRFIQRVQEWRDRPIDELRVLFDKEITDWNGSENFLDDVSMVIFKYTGKR